MKDTTRRFLNAVLERVAESRIVEVRLFPAIQQGGVESGVAVLAVEPEPDPIPGEAGEVALGDGVTVEFEALSGSTEVEVSIAHPSDAAREPEEVFEVDTDALEQAGAAPLATPDIGDAVLEELEREAALEVVAEGVSHELPSVADAPVEVAVEFAAVDLPADAATPLSTETIALGDILSLPSPARGSELPARRRLAILCARYRLALKGPERGKWDLEVVHQADAPLDTLDRVIAGVVRRSGSDADPERFSRESLRASLDAPVWAESA